MILVFKNIAIYIYICIYKYNKTPPFCAVTISMVGKIWYDVIISNTLVTKMIFSPQGLSE